MCHGIVFVTFWALSIMRSFGLLTKHKEKVTKASALVFVKPLQTIEQADSDSPHLSLGDASSP